MTDNGDVVGSVCRALECVVKEKEAVTARGGTKELLLVCGSFFIMREARAALGDKLSSLLLDYPQPRNLCYIPTHPMRNDAASRP